MIGQAADVPTKRGGGGGGGGAGGPRPRTGPPTPKGVNSSAKSCDTDKASTTSREKCATLGSSQTRPITATSAILELEIHGYHVGVLEPNRTGGKRSDKALRSVL